TRPAKGRDWSSRSPPVHDRTTGQPVAEICGRTRRTGRVVRGEDPAPPRPARTRHHRRPGGHVPVPPLGHHRQRRHADSSHDPSALRARVDLPRLPGWKGAARRIHPTDVVLSLASAAALGYVFVDFEGFIYRAVVPNTWDLVFGVLTILLILEATRRSVGNALLVVVGGFILYAFAGPWLPA